MVKSETKTVGGLKFQLAMVPAMQSLEVLPRVLALVGPAVGTLKEVITADGKVDRTKLLGLATGMIGQLGKASPRELREVAEILLAPCQVQQEGKWVELLPVFDAVMQGRIFTVLNLIAWAVQLNFQDFFALLPAAKSADGAAEAGSSAPATS